MPKECECPTHHSVAKLGHSDICTYYRRNQETRVHGGLLTLFGCPPAHNDGTKHDFDWASYEGETVTTGVCRCGLREIDYDLMTMP